MSLGANPVPLASTNPGTIIGNLDKRAGDIVAAGRRSESGVPAPNLQYWGRLAEVARENGRMDDAVVRDEFTKFWILAEVNRLTAMRGRTKGASMASPNISKLMMSDLYRSARELGASVLGMEATLSSQGDFAAARNRGHCNHHHIEQDTGVGFFNFGRFYRPRKTMLTTAILAVYKILQKGRTQRA